MEWVRTSRILEEAKERRRGLVLPSESNGDGCWGATGRCLRSFLEINTCCWKEKQSMRARGKAETAQSPEAWDLRVVGDEAEWSFKLSK